MALTGPVASGLALSSAVQRARRAPGNHYRAGVGSPVARESQPSALRTALPARPAETPAAAAVLARHRVLPTTGLTTGPARWIPRRPGEFRIAGPSRAQRQIPGAATLARSAANSAVPETGLRTPTQSSYAGPGLRAGGTLPGVSHAGITTTRHPGNLPAQLKRLPPRTHLGGDAPPWRSSRGQRRCHAGRPPGSGGHPRRRASLVPPRGTVTTPAGKLPAAALASRTSRQPPAQSSSPCSRRRRPGRVRTRRCPSRGAGRRQPARGAAVGEGVDRGRPAGDVAGDEALTRSSGQALRGGPVAPVPCARPRPPPGHAAGNRRRDQRDPGVGAPAAFRPCRPGRTHGVAREPQRAPGTAHPFRDPPGHRDQAGEPTGAGPCPPSTTGRAGWTAVGAAGASRPYGRPSPPTRGRTSVRGPGAARVAPARLPIARLAPTSTPAPSCNGCGWERDPAGQRPRRPPPLTRT